MNSTIAFAVTFTRHVLLFAALATLWAVGARGATLLGVDIGDSRVMVILQNRGGAEGFIEYAENLLKSELKSRDFNIINPEIMKKIKKDKLLMEAINNGNATALATINADYGAGILVRGGYLLDSHTRFGSSYEASAVLNVTIINTKTASEIGVLVSDPMGTTANPMPIEDSPLIAKQKAVRMAMYNVVEKMGFAGSAGPSKFVTISPQYYDAISGVHTSTLLFTPDEKLLLYGAGASVHRWDIFRRMRTGPVINTKSKVTAMAMDPAGRTLAVGTDTGFIKLYDFATGERRRSYKAHGGTVTTIAYSRDGNFFASGATDARINVFSAQTGKSLYRIRGPKKAVRTVRFSPNGRMLIVASADRTIRVYDVNVQKEVRAFSETSNRLLSADISADGTLIAIAAKKVVIDILRNRRTDTELIKVRDMRTGEELLTLEGHNKTIVGLQFMPGKRFLVSAGEDRKINIWDLQEGAPIATLRVPRKVTAVRVSPRGQWLASADGSGQIQLWKLQ